MIFLLFSLNYDLFHEFWTSWPENKTMIVCPNDLKILKMELKFENYDFFQYLTVSYVKNVVKIWMNFEHFFMYYA
jgi:hypothetical protein